MDLEQKAKKKVNDYHRQLKNFGLVTDRIEKKQYSFEFSVSNGKNKIKVNVYFGKKGLKSVLQGDEKSDFFAKVKNPIIDEPELLLRTSNLVEPEKYIGTDECGKGDFFGPLVVGAVYVDNQTKPELIKLGVRDSKELSEYQIGFLAKEIRKIVKNNFEIIKITPLKYNELYDQFKNLNKLLNWAHSKAIENLIERTNCKYVITDKFSKAELLITSSSKFSNTEFVQIEKAERFIGVAAGSILARDVFNHWFISHLQKGLNLPKGASGNVELYASNLLKKIGEEKIVEIAKLHFKTFKKIVSN